MADVRQRVNAILQGSVQREQVSALKELASQAARSTDADAGAAELCALIEEVVKDNVQLVVSRPVLLHLAELLNEPDCVKQLGAENIRKISEHGIKEIKDKRTSFDNIDGTLRQTLGEMLVEAEDYIEAANVFAGINFESSRFSDEDKARYYVRITELYLEEDDAVNAEMFVNRAGQFIHEIKDPLIIARHKVSYARVLDSKRKFLDAAHRYYQLSTESLQNGQAVREEDLLHLLCKSMTCALLASAGPQRTRMLNLLYKDERTKLIEVHFPILERMFMERILSKKEVQAFENELEPHQKALLADGTSILDRAVLEHNMLAVSKIYLNITFSELGKLLGIEAAQAERICARMVKEKRMNAAIDQVDGLLIFDEKVDSLGQLDSRISELCQGVNNILGSAGKRHPQFSVGL